MKAWYSSYDRFESSIKKRWEKNKFDYHNGHLHLLRYSYQTMLFWAMINNKKISKKNALIGYPKLF